MRLRPIHLAVALVWAAACVVNPAPVPTPPVPVVPAPVMRVSVFAPGGGFAAGVSGSVLLEDAAQTTVTATVEDGRLRFDLPAWAQFGWGAWLTVCAEALPCRTVRMELAADVNIAFVKPPLLPSIRLADRYGFVDPEGRRVPMKAVSGFQLLEFEAHGRQAEADAFYAAMQPANCVRVFLLLDGGMFILNAEDGLAALPASLERAERHGYYQHYTLFAGNKDKGKDWYRDIAARFGDICARRPPALVAAELGNELYPLHGTQNAHLEDLDFLKELRAVIKARGCDIPISLGSTHGSEDESDHFQDGDYLTIHGDRAHGDDGWRWVRHTKEQQDLSARLGKHAWNDEPQRADNATGHTERDKHLAMGAMCRLFGLSDTYHYGAGRFGQPATGAERSAFEARAQGWAAIPDDWTGQYLNAGFSNSPVKSANGTVRSYASVRGGEGYVLVMGAEQGQAHEPEWHPDWPHRTKVLGEGQMQLWHVTR